MRRWTARSYHDYKQFADEANRADYRNYQRIRQDDEHGYPKREITEADWDELYPIMRRMGDHTGDQLEQPQPEYFDLEPALHSAPRAPSAESNDSPTSHDAELKHCSTQDEKDPCESVKSVASSS